MVWDFAEADPFSSVGGNFEMFIDRSADVILALPLGSTRATLQQDAASLVEQEQVMVSTDPPYYDNIGYAGLSDSFMFGWGALFQSFTEAVRHNPDSEKSRDDRESLPIWRRQEEGGNSSSRLV